MGLFGIGDDPAKEAAKEARKAEEQRQARISEGISSIDEIFGGENYYEVDDAPGQTFTSSQLRRHRDANPVAGPRAGTRAGPIGERLSGMIRSSNPIKAQKMMRRVAGLGGMHKGRGPFDFSAGRSGGGGPFGFIAGRSGGGGATSYMDGARLVERRGGLDDPRTYDRMKSDYEEHYMPQLEDQYGRAKTDLKSILSGQGILNSSAGQRRFSDMLRDYNQQRQQVSNRGLQRASQARAEMEDVRANLISQVEGGMDIGRVGDMARRQASMLGGPQTYEPLADVFSTGTGVLSSALQAERAGRRGLGGMASKIASPFSAGSSRVIN